MTHWAHLNIWPDELINLNMELKHHPELQERLANHPVNEWEIKIAEIALYCEVVVDGEYLPEEMTKLASILEQRLRLRRKDNRSVLVLN
jgi:hypothetical protein